MSITVAVADAARPGFGRLRLEVLVEEGPPRKACDIKILSENPSAPSSQPPEKMMCRQGDGRHGEALFYLAFRCRFGTAYTHVRCHAPLRLQ